MAHLNILPEPAFFELRSALNERLARVAAGIQAEQFDSLLDPLMREVLKQGFAEAGGHEGTVWLVDEAGKNLVPAYNTGPQAAQFVGQFKQPLNAGLICMVFATEQPFLENEVPADSRQSKLLDKLLKVQTRALIAVPFSFLQACRGVVSCVQLAGPERENTGTRNGFSPQALACIQRTTALMAQLIEYKLLSRTVGWMSQ